MARRALRVRPLLCDLLESRITPTADPFTLVAMPDTQHYSEFPTLNGIIHAQTQWIVDHRVSDNIAFVMGLGDIVQHGNNNAEWLVADAAFDRLDGDLQTNPDGLVPYSTPPGNHDYLTQGVQSSGATLFQQYFGAATRFANRSWFGDSYKDINTYSYFSAGGHNFLQIALEYEPTDDVIDWARFVIAANPGMPTILSTHSYIFDTSMSRRITAASAEGASGETLFRKLVYPNSQIFMVLNGHFNNTNLPGGGGEYHQVSQNARGLPVFEMLSDYQERENQDTGLMRLIRFDPAANQIQVKTYSPSQNIYETDFDSQFTFNVNFAERFAAGAPDPVKLSVFQEGMDLGQGLYTGVQDTQLREATPTTSFADDPSDLLVDFANANNASQVLLRFDNVFGAGVGQVPPGARIFNATLTVDSNNAGAGGRLHRMVANWNESATWNGLGTGIQANNSEARTNYESQAGFPALTPLVPANDRVHINVTADVEAWAAGEANRGWAILPWTNGTDGWAFAPGEGATAALHPKLRIEWMPAATNPNEKTLVFQQGINGYTGTVDTYLEEVTPTADYSTATKLFTDLADANNTQTALIRFDNLFGSAANQIRSDAVIDAAYLYLTTPYHNANALGDGGAFHRPMQSWPATANWSNSFGGNGIQPNNLEAVAAMDWNTGSVGFGVIRVDVTNALRLWQAGTPNYGFAFLANSTDGWQVSSSDSEIPGDRPRLQVIVRNDPPRVASVTMNDGATQRSIVESVTIEFSTQVFGPGGAPLSAAEFELKRIDGVVVNPQLTLQDVGGRTVVRIDNFTGPGAAFGSLLDGRWTLRALSTIRNASGQMLDGNGDGLGGDDYLLIGNVANKFFRLFGDGNGDGTVDAGDFAAFGDDFGQTGFDSPFDFLGDGSVDATDLAQFGARFGMTL